MRFRWVIRVVRGVDVVKIFFSGEESGSRSFFDRLEGLGSGVWGIFFGM